MNALVLKAQQRTKVLEQLSQWQAERRILEEEANRLSQADHWHGVSEGTLKAIARIEGQIAGAVALAIKLGLLDEETKPEQFY